MPKFTSKIWGVLFNFRLPEIPAYGLLYFDHLRSEKATFETVSVQGTPLISAIDKQALDDIDTKREMYRRQTGDESQYLTWQDIYTYELLLLKYRDFNDLKSKILSLRTKYRNVAGQKEYDIYLASKPPDLAAITNPQDQIDLLRGDLEYLLREFFSLYSYMTAREQLRSKILVWTTALTLIVLLIAAFYSQTGNKTTNKQNTNSPDAAKSTMTQTTSSSTVVSNINRANANDGANVNASPSASPGTGDTMSGNVDSTEGEGGRRARGIGIISVIIFAGVMGAFVSMHQRIQSSPSEGDPVYTFSMLMHGWFSIFLSPVSGAVFAVVLYLFFSGQLLTGKIFPKIVTYSSPVADATPSPALSPMPAQSPLPTPQTANTPIDGAAPGPTPAQSPVPSPSPLPSPSNVVQEGTPSATTQTPTPSGETAALDKFLRSTGPETGVDFALLVIWSFIAGFAERFVPDTLSRLISRNEAADRRV